MDDSFTMVSAPSDVNVSVKLSAEKKALPAAAEHTFHAMATVTAAKAEEDERPPMQITAVLDQSTSMIGEKFHSVKETMIFFAEKGLREEDTFSIVTYGEDSEVVLAPTRMDHDGVKKATNVIRKLQTKGRTNLSGGLLEGISQITGQAAVPGMVRAVLLCTDGQANLGIQDTEGIVKAAVGAVGGNSVKIHTFGFGTEVNENMLLKIAESFDGSYFFVNGAEDIPAAFGAALGSLSSVVAQNAKLTLSYDSDVAALKVLGAYTKTVDASAKTVTVSLGDLYSQDKKDIVLEMTLVKKAWPDAESKPVMSAAVSFFDVAENGFLKSAASLGIARPEKATGDEPANLDIEENLQRVRLADAMSKSADYRSAGRFGAGRELLEGAMTDVRRSASGKAPVLLAMLKGCEAALAQLVAAESEPTGAPGYQSLAAAAAAPPAMRALSSGFAKQKATGGATDGLYSNAAMIATRQASCAAVAVAAPPAGVGHAVPPPITRMVHGRDEHMGHLAPPAPKRQAASP